MSEYERTATIPAAPDRVFSFLTNPENMPRFLPTLQSAELEPGGRLHIRGQADGHAYDSEGYFRADADRRRMEWGAEAEHDYNGWLQVDPDGASSRVTVHLSFAPRNETAERIDEETGDKDRTITDTMDRTLERIKQLISGDASR